MLQAPQGILRKLPCLNQGLGNVQINKLRWTKFLLGSCLCDKRREIIIDLVNKDSGVRVGWAKEVSPGLRLNATLAALWQCALRRGGNLYI